MKTKRFLSLLLCLCMMLTLLPITTQAAGSAPVGTWVQLSSLPAGSTVNFAGLTWIVLDNGASSGSAYLLTQNVLNENPYIQTFCNKTTYPSFNLSSGIGRYLNSWFLHALPQAEQSLIQDHIWNTGPYDPYDDYRRNQERYLNLQCKVGLISYSEYLTYSSYLGKCYSDLVGANSSWWTITPYWHITDINDGNGVWEVNKDQDIWLRTDYFPVGLFEAMASPFIGASFIRPALYLNSADWVYNGAVRPFDPTRCTVAASLSSVACGASSSVAVTLLDHGGEPVNGVAVQLTSSSHDAKIDGGSPGAPASGTTDGNGQVTFPVTDDTPEMVSFMATTDTVDNLLLTQSPRVQFTPNLIAPDTLEIYNGETYNLDASFGDSYTGDRSGTWSAADSSVASVKDDSIAPISINSKHVLPAVIRGKVTGKKPGTTTVTFINTATGVRDSCTVTVKPSFVIAPDQIKVYEGETGSLSAVFDEGYTGSKAGRWIVDDQSVASIDQNGVVTGIKAGTAVAYYTVLTRALKTKNSSAAADGAAVAIAEPFSLAVNQITRTVIILVKPGTCTVTFSGANPNPPAVTVKHDTTVTKPADPTPPGVGIKFIGWFTSPDGVDKWDFDNDKVTRDMTLYAQWAVPVKRISPGSGGSVHIAPVITGPDSIDLTAGYPSTDQAYTVSGNPAPALTITANTAGATLNGNTLTIPAGLSAGSYSVTLEAANSVGTATKTVTVNVAAAPITPTAPVITGPDTIDLAVGYDGVEQEYTIGGSPAPTLTIITPNTASATLSGNTLTIPAGLGGASYIVTLEATNSAGTATKTVTVNVSSPPTIDGPDEIDLTDGYEEYQQVYTFGGDPAPTEFELTEPNTANAVFDATTGTLTIPVGLLASDYPYYVTIKATSTVGTEEFTICVYVTP